MESKIVLPVVAFLSIVAIGARLLYLYLRQEHDKVIPKDAYNQAQTDFYTRRNRRRSNPTMTSIVVSRLLIFYSTFVSVLALFMLVMAIRTGDNTLHNIVFVLLSIIGSPVILLVFPLGITAFFAPEAVFSRNFEGLWVGYSLYLVICSLGIFVKDRRVFAVIYLIFIALLIMNVVGCSRICINPDGCP